MSEGFSLHLPKAVSNIKGVFDMAKQIKGFVTCDSYIDNAPGVVAPLYEISGQGSTYARDKQQYFSSLDSLYALHVFHHENADLLSQSEVNSVVEVVKQFVRYVTLNRTVTKQSAVVAFMSNYNIGSPSAPVSDMTVSSLLDLGDTVVPDYISFTMQGIECAIWLNDGSFRGFYPHYDIDIVFPFDGFASIVNNGAAMMTAISGFQLVEFNKRIEEMKGNRPTTYTAILNIPYKLPNSTVMRDLHFAFNQYGSQGNYDYVLKLKLYEYLLSLGMTSEYIESIFPSILKINEFFFTPRWKSMAIPSQVGQVGIMSQVSRAYDTAFDLDKYIKVYTDLAFLKMNSYNVPYDYNNLLLTVTNGFYSDEAVRDFRVVYKDLITVTTTHPEFARMSRRTQRLVTLLESMLVICDSDTTTQMFTKMMDNEIYDFNILTRQSVNYLSIQYEGHQIYMIPKFEYLLHEAS